jgi:hypothetical protein
VNAGLATQSGHNVAGKGRAATVDAVGALVWAPVSKQILPEQPNFQADQMPVRRLAVRRRYKDKRSVAIILNNFWGAETVTAVIPSIPRRLP